MVMGPRPPTYKTCTAGSNRTTSLKPLQLPVREDRASCRYHLHLKCSQSHSELCSWSGLTHLKVDRSMTGRGAYLYNAYDRLVVRVCYTEQSTVSFYRYIHYTIISSACFRPSEMPRNSAFEDRHHDAPMHVRVPFPQFVPRSQACFEQLSSAACTASAWLQ
jgi:hypothetical protein